MTKPRAPRNVEQGTALLQRYAILAGDIAAIEANRASALASTNAVADRLAAPLIEEVDGLKEVLAPWWQVHAAALTAGKRKSIELGGCMVGTKLTRAALQHGFADDAAALAALKDERWAKPYVRVSYAVDRTATFKGLDGTHGKRLAELGFAKKPAVDVFFIERVEQAGVVSPA